VYVDDIIFGSTNKAWCDEFEVLMKGEFQMSVMGELTFFLGLQVKQLPDGIFISQDKYVKDMLKKFDMESVRTATIPYEVPKHKSKDEPDDAVNVHLFRFMIGSLMYLTASRPDIIQLISWQCKKQTVVATSSTEAEYVTFASCCGQLLVHADEFVFAGGYSLPAGSYSFLLLDWFLLDDHNKVAYLEKGKGWEAYEQILDFLNRSHIRYALTHRPTMVFDSLVKQFWATATVCTLEAGPSDIIAIIYVPMLVVSASGDAAGASVNVAAGPGPSYAPQVPHEREPSPVRDPTPVKEPSPVRDPTPVREPSPRPEPKPTPDSP
nr:hypothetical protein [Tanacetum cinerariifolium]